MKTIPLTQGKVTVVDDDVYEWASKFKWHTLKTERRFYAVRSSPRKTDEKRQSIYLHREILQPKSSMNTDHIDGDGLNNLRKNLRPVTDLQNARAFRRAVINKSSKFRGVTWLDKTSLQKYVAGIRIGGKRLYLGVFEKEEDAARAYDAAARKYYGEFAQPNFSKC